MQNINGLSFPTDYPVSAFHASSRLANGINPWKSMEKAVDRTARNRSNIQGLNNCLQISQLLEEKKTLPSDDPKILAINTKIQELFTNTPFDALPGYSHSQRKEEVLKLSISINSWEEKKLELQKKMAATPPGERKAIQGQIFKIRENQDALIARLRSHSYEISKTKTPTSLDEIPHWINENFGTPIKQRECKKVIASLRSENCKLWFKARAISLFAVALFSAASAVGSLLKSVVKAFTAIPVTAINLLSTTPFSDNWGIQGFLLQVNKTASYVFLTPVSPLIGLVRPKWSMDLNRTFHVCFERKISTGAEFNDWLNDSLKKLHETHDEAHIAGRSMGQLLKLNQTFHDKAKGLSVKQEELNREILTAFEKNDKEALEIAKAQKTSITYAKTVLVEPLRNAISQKIALAESPKMTPRNLLARLFNW